MTSHLESVTISNDTHWTWNVMPLLAATLALGIVFFPQGHVPADDALARVLGDEAPTVVMLLVPSPQPGLGEPEPVVADLPQSY